jgi:DsbC/DsbD-like thiol-disulfide interchange protein
MTPRKNIRPLPVLLAAGLISIAAYFPVTAEITPDPVKAELIADAAGVRPGEPFMIGVFFKIQPKWHMYWKYSGDAGLPPEIQWQLPDGWTAKEIEWPLPQRFVENGPLTTFGYKDSVLLMAQITPPANITSSTPVTINARVNWMVCRDECIPGKATLSLNLPISAAASRPPAKSAADARFAFWRRRLPDAGEPAGIVVDVKSRLLDDSGKTAQVTYRFATPTGAAHKTIDWFPAPTQDYAVKKASCNSSGDNTIISFVLHSFAGPIPAGQELESLLVYQDQSGRRRGVHLLTPLKRS